MKEIELSPTMSGELEDPVVEFLEKRGAVWTDEDGVVHLAKEHSFSYHEVLMLMTNDVNVVT